MAFSRKSKMAEADPELDMVPIMNMFLVLIPFLLLSASFLHIKVINTSVPVLASGTSSVDDTDKQKKSDVKVRVIVELKTNKIVLSAMSDELDYKELKNLGGEIGNNDNGDFSLEQLAVQLEQIKDKYPKSDTVVLVPGVNVLYETIIKAMDVSRTFNEKQLFQNVVLSGKIG